MTKAELIKLKEASMTSLHSDFLTPKGDQPQSVPLPSSGPSWERVISAPFMFAIGFAMGVLFATLACLLAQS